MTVEWLIVSGMCCEPISKCICPNLVVKSGSLLSDAVIRVAGDR